MKWKSEGFSLIEVIIAVAILAILTIPLLAYFDYAARNAGDGKKSQKAGMAAQSVVEELNSCTTFDEIETKLILATGSAWTVNSVDATQTNMTKKVTIDDTDYQAKVNIDYGYSNLNAEGDEIGAKFNDYALPQLSEVYSENSVVLSESDQLSTAVSNFYYQNSSVSKSSIEAAITRTLILDVEKVFDVYVVQGYYQYGYDRETFDAQIDHLKIEAAKLKNIYVFYNLLREDIENEPIVVNFKNISIEEAKELNLFFVAQKGSITKPIGYSLSISGSGNYMQPTYLTNGNPSSTLSVKKEIVTHKKEKRIALVTVDIYYQEETVFIEENRLARIQTSKGE